MICIKKCFHRGRLYNKGDSYIPVPGEKVPHHFAEKPAADDPTPRLGTKVGVKSKQFPAIKAPGKDVATIGSKEE